MKAKLIFQQHEVANRLEELFGATKEQLLQVVYEGVSGRNECTANHPASMPGIRCWGDATRALRDLFLQMEGWKLDSTDNIASVVNQRRGIKIAVTNATYDTGIESGHPQPIRDKGDGAQRAFFANQTVFREIFGDSLNNNAPGTFSFWYLAIYCGADMVRAELLCPIFAEDGSFKDFQERILLISDQDDNGGMRITRDVPESPDGDSGFEISVTRKQAAK